MYLTNEHEDKYFDTNKYYDLIDKYENLKKYENNYLDEIDKLKISNNKLNNKNMLLEEDIKIINDKKYKLLLEFKNDISKYKDDICELNICITKLNKIINEFKNKIEEYKMQNLVLEDQIQSRDEELEKFRSQCDNIDIKRDIKIEKLKKILNEIL